MITDIPGGVSEEETSHNSQVVLLIRAHAKTVAGFVRQGLEATHQNTPLPKGYHSDAGAAAENPPSGGFCHGLWLKARATGPTGLVRVCIKSLAAAP